MMRFNALAIVRHGTDFLVVGRVANAGMLSVVCVSAYPGLLRARIEQEPEGAFLVPLHVNTTINHVEIVLAGSNRQRNHRCTSLEFCLLYLVDK